MLGGMGAPTHDELLTSRQAAERLGVKLTTLYAYVARGLIRQVDGADGARKTPRPQAQRYAASEIESFMARRRWARRVIASAVSSTDGGRLLYRGHDAVDLAERARFEQVAALLWRGELPAEPPRWAEVDRAAVAPAIRTARALGAPAALLVPMLVLALAPADPDRAGRGAAGVAAAGERLVTRLVAAYAGATGGDQAGASRGPMAARVLAALGAHATPEAVRVAERALVLSAEHELNASTFAARVAASTGADVYAVLAAAASTLGGPKHGGMTGVVEAVLARGDRDEGTSHLPGFGHPLYPRGDPRARPLLEAARAHAARGSRRRELAAVLARVDALAARRGPPPTIDAGLVATACALDLPRGAAAVLFAFGRTAGWIAHAIEQYAMGELIRPRARYVGARPEGA